MRSCVPRINQQLSLTAVIVAAFLASTEIAAQSYQLDSDRGLQPHNVTVDHAVYQGRKAIRVRSKPSADATYDPQKSGTGGGIVVLEGSSFHDGTIEVDVWESLRRMRLPWHVGLLGLRSACHPTLPGMTTSTYVLQTGAPTIRSGETTRLNTRPSPTTNG